MGGQCFSLHLTEKVGIRKTALQFARPRPVANDDLRAREIEREERRQVLFYREPPDADEYRAGQIERCGALGPERSVSTPRVHIARCAKPRWPSSSSNERVDTIVTAAAA